MAEVREKEALTKTKYCVIWDEHTKNVCKVLCSLLEHQSLVDVMISCNAYTVHAHKCILAANSPYFREQLEQNPNTEQIVFNGLDHLVVKSIIEFIYCGQTIILDEHVHALISAASFLQISGLKILLKAEKNCNAENEIVISPPTFLGKKPKVAGAAKNPIEIQNPQNFQPPTNSTNFTVNPVNPYGFRRVKRKYVRTEADKACAQEANASRLALEALQRELENSGDPRFEIEESCVETTVESFIPSARAEMHYLNQLNTIPIQVVNYEDLNGSVIETRAAILDESKLMAMNKSCMEAQSGTMHNNRSVELTSHENMTSDKIKQFLTDVPNNVEIMFKTSEGNFVGITDEVLQNITEGTLQYQVIDENGEAGEIRELQVHQKVQENDQTYPTEHISVSSLEVNPLQESALIQERMEAPQSLHFDNMTNMNNYPNSLLLDKSSEMLNLISESEEEHTSEVYKAYQRVLEPHKFSKNIPDKINEPHLEDHFQDNGIEKFLTEISNERAESLQSASLKNEINCASIYPNQQFNNIETFPDGNTLGMGMGNGDVISNQVNGNMIDLSMNCDVLDLTNHPVKQLDGANSDLSCNLTEDGGGDCSNSIKKLPKNKKKQSKTPSVLEENDFLTMPGNTTSEENNQNTNAKV